MTEVLMVYAVSSYCVCWRRRHYVVT